MKRFHLLHPVLIALLAALILMPGSAQGARTAGDPGGHTNRGVKYARAKQYDKAIEEFTKAIEAQPKDPKNYRNRALAYRLSKEPKKAAADYAKAIELSPDSADARTGSARLLLRDKKAGAALKELDKALEIDPRNRPALRLRAYIYLQQGKWEKAIADYNVSINSIADVDIEGRTRRGFAYRNLKKYDLALEDFTKVIEAQPKDVEAYRRRVYIYRLLKQDDKATTDLKRILKLKPTDADAKKQLRALESAAPAASLAAKPRAQKKPGMKAKPAPSPSPR
ncbi:MAG: tetratricopeptide repeat protein [Chthoniobacterales bacterium]